MLYLYIFLRRLSLRSVYFIIYVNYGSPCVSAPAIGTIVFSFCNVIGISKSQNKVKSSFLGCLFLLRIQEKTFKSNLVLAGRPRI